MNKILVIFICAILIFYIIYRLRSVHIKVNENFKPMYDIQNPPNTMTAMDVGQMRALQRGITNNDFTEYRVGDFPNVTYTPQVVGCGSRREPCYGGSQQVINNILPPLNISNDNIAPSNIELDGNYMHDFYQVGVAYKIFSNNNEILPLYTLKNGRQYDYFIMPEMKERKFIKVLNDGSPLRRLGTNDIIKIPNREGTYRVTVYEEQYPTNATALAHPSMRMH
jgi:hypothetical protein